MGDRAAKVLKIKQAVRQMMDDVNSNVEGIAFFAAVSVVDKDDRHTPAFYAATGGRADLVTLMGNVVGDILAGVDSGDTKKNEAARAILMKAFAAAMQFTMKKKGQWKDKDGANRRFMHKKGGNA